MFKRFWKLIEKHEETEEKQQKIMEEQCIEIIKLKTAISIIKAIIKLNRAGMADICLSEIKELVDNLENNN